MTTAVATNYRMTDDDEVPAQWCDQLQSSAVVNSIQKSAKEGKLWKEIQHVKTPKMVLGAGAGAGAKFGAGAGAGAKFGAGAGAGVKLGVGQKLKLSDYQWVIVNPNDPLVIEIAKYAVAQFETSLEFVQVNLALKMQFTIVGVAVDIYALMIQTDDGIYGAVVAVGPLDIKVLLQFAKLPIIPPSN